MTCRIEIKFAQLARVDTVRAETSGKSFDLYDEQTWTEVGSTAVEGPLEFVCNAARWAVDCFDDISEVPEEAAPQQCRCQSRLGLTPQQHENDCPLTAREECCDE